MNRFLLIAGFVWCFISPTMAQVLPADAFKTKLADVPNAQLLDVRTPNEFANGHLPKAQNVNVQDTGFEANAAKLDKTKPVFIYCLSGGRSQTASAKLRSMGYENVYELQGGYLKWTAKMMPIVGVTRNTTPTWTSARLDSLVKSQSVVLVDVYAAWCGPCQKMMPYVDKLTQEFAGRATVVKVNADADKEIMAQYAIDEIPVFLLFRDGKLVSRNIGLQEESRLRGLLTQ
jgi:thioredoxin 1